RRPPGDPDPLVRTGDEYPTPASQCPTGKITAALSQPGGAEQPPTKFAMKLEPISTVYLDPRSADGGLGRTPRGGGAGRQGRPEIHTSSVTRLGGSRSHRVS